MTIVAVVALGVAALAPGDEARARLQDRQGKQLGVVELRQTPQGVLIRGALEGLPPGVRAIHVHRVGRCEPTFDAAGDHFAPGGAAHGYEAPQGPHAGDLPNLHVAADGTAAFELFTRELSLSEGPTALLDGDGAAIVVHAKPDDYRTQPSGGAGDRIACGVVERSRPRQSP